MDNPQPLYDRLLASTVRRSDSIFASYTLNHANGSTTGPIPGIPSYVNIQNRENSWRIFVPNVERQREVCYKMHLPMALAKQLNIPEPCEKIVGLVLTSSTSVLDELLETAGVGNVSSVEPSSRDLAHEVERPTEGQRGTPVLTSERMSRPLAREQLDIPRALIVIHERPQITSNYERPVQTPDSEPGPETDPESEANLEADPEPELEAIPNLPVRSVQNDTHTYTQLLDHVIRIARWTYLPQSDFAAAPGQGDYLPGFNRQNAFGVRALNQVLHDTNIGAAGELFVSLSPTPTQISIKLALNSVGLRNIAQSITSRLWGAELEKYNPPFCHSSSAL
jgi:hypothetical protein